MIEINEKSKCCGCGACADICPAKCISMVYDEEGFLYPKADKNLCINCNLCEKVCSFDCKIEKTTVRSAYAYKTNNIKNLADSSSGGFFSDIAGSIIDKNGIVYGTALTENCTKAKVVGVDSKESLGRLRGSKYFQSEANASYIEIKKFLDSNVQVLFSGTPCQVNGLKMFLGKEYDNLICIDIICHGVPSSILWNKYLQNLKENTQFDIEKINFRSKKYGWSGYGLEITDNKGNAQFLPRRTNPFMRMFLYDYSLRPSCYECKAKNKNLSDITIGDFWGIDNICPQINDDKGTSIIIVRTEKGEKCLNEILSMGKYQQIDYYSAVKYNPADIQSAEKPRQREKFYKDLEKYPFEKMIKKYAEDSLLVKAKNILKSLKHKL